MSRVEEPAYTVERSEGPIEIRAYPSLIMATTTVRGERRSAIREGFEILAGYIFGGNDQAKKVEMTAPVMQERAPGGMARTGAVEPAQNVWTVRFVMPRGWSLDTLPKAKDNRVAITKTPAATYAVIRFSGFARDAALEEKTRDLMAFVAESKLKALGSPIYAFYNPPWTLPFLRRNEIMVEVASGRP